MLTKYIVSLGSLFFASTLFAGHLPVDYTIPRISEKIIVDGRLDESVWQKANRVELNYETAPSENRPAMVKTVAYIYEDGEFLYLGFDARDPEVHNIRAYYNDRDDSWSDDMVSILIDTFNDERRAYQFFVNPLGVQSDSVIDEVNNNEDFSWNAIWDSAGVIDSQGYRVEMVIPLRAIRFNDILEHQVWGIEFIRFYPRDDRYRFSSMKRSRDSACDLCQLQKAQGLPEIKATSNIDIIPTATISHTQEREDIAQSNWKNSDTDIEMGADLRWSINQDVHLNATINPDFSQVEADSAQLSVNTQFSLFFPEKRTFFLDGADYFSSPNSLIHTRNIADPDYGLKITGKTNAHAYGIIVANDTRTSFLVPSNQGSYVQELDHTESEVFIGRWRQDVGKKNSIGALITHREGGDYQNDVYALDGRFWPSENDSIEVQMMTSDVEMPIDLGSGNSNTTTQNGNAYTVRYRHQDRDWNWFFEHVNVDRDFRADLGFISQVDYVRTDVGVQPKWYFDNEQFLSHFNINSNYDRTEDQAGNILEEEVEVWFNFDGKNQFYGWFGGGRRDRYVEAEFQLEYVPTGVDPNDPNYLPDFHDFSLNRRFYETFIGTGVFFRPVANIKLGMRGQFSDRVDVHNVQLGTIHEFSPEISWRWNEHFTTDLRFTKSWLNVDQGKLYEAKLADLRISYQHDLRHRIRASVQYLDLQRDPELYNARYRNISNLNDYLIEGIDRRYKDMAIQLIYSYKVNPQTLIFAGYSSHGYQDDRVDGIKLDRKSLFAKFSYAFQM